MTRIATDTSHVVAWNHAGDLGSDGLGWDPAAGTENSNHVNVAADVPSPAPKGLSASTSRLDAMSSAEFTASYLRWLAA